MSALEDAFRRAVADVEDLGRPYALVGGFAVAVRANPRLTLDVDLVLAVESDDQAEEAVRHLVSAGYAVEATVDQEATGRLATVRLRSPLGGALVDLLLASTGIEPQIAASASVLEVLPGLDVPVACVGHLIVMKVLARDDRHRPADADDLVHLARIASDADWRVARSAADTIHDIGTNRGRDLRAAIDDCRGEV